MGELASITGNHQYFYEVEEGTDLYDLLNIIEKNLELGIQDKLDNGSYVILKNGINYTRLDNSDKILEDGDKVSIAPVLGGG